MADLAEQPEIDEAAALQSGRDQAVEACASDARAAVTALIGANGMLEQDLRDVYVKASHGFIRGRRVKAKAKGFDLMPGTELVQGRNQKGPVDGGPF